MLASQPVFRANFVVRERIKKKIYGDTGEKTHQENVRIKKRNADAEERIIFGSEDIYAEDGFSKRNKYGEGRKPSRAKLSS